MHRCLMDVLALDLNKLIGTYKFLYGHLDYGFPIPESDIKSTGSATVAGFCEATAYPVELCGVAGRSRDTKRCMFYPIFILTLECQYRLRRAHSVGCYDLMYKPSTIVATLHWMAEQIKC